MLSIKIIIGSVRPGRKGPSIASWVHGKAKTIPDWNVELIDLTETGLPMHDEPEHPRFRRYVHDHTKRWSHTIDSADGYIFVTPEYNYSAPPALLNAMNFVYHEWAYKPAAFVSYGGLAGGTRAVQMLKQTVTALKMMPVFEGVFIPFFIKQFDEQGRFVPSEQNEHAAEAMLKELGLWAEGLKAMRESMK